MRPSDCRRRCVVRSACAATIGSVLVAGVTARADDWESYQHDPQHTGQINGGPDPSSLTLNWSAPAGFSNPLIVGNTVYGLQTGGGTNTPTHVAAFNLADGSQRWNISDTYVFPSEEAYGAGDIVYTGATLSDNLANKLYVLDATTGAQKYAISVPEGLLDNITVATDTTTNQPVAYVSDGNHVSAVRLGGTSGTVLWTAAGGFGDSIAAVMGNSLLLASPLQYYAVNRTTGAVNHFYNGPGDGGGGTAPVVDLARNQFYVSELYGTASGAATALTAYRNVNGVISKIWQDTGTGVQDGGAVALGPDGTIYSADHSTLVEIDPATGNILRAVQGQFALNNAPLVSNGYVWEYGPGEAAPGSTANDTYAYRLRDLSLAATFAGTRGDLNTSYDGIGALDDTHLIIAHGGSVDVPGFDVFSGVSAASRWLPGDANFDGKVDVVDLGILATHFGQQGNATWSGGDFNADGSVDVVDLGILATNFGRGTTMTAAEARAALSADLAQFPALEHAYTNVPEPASFALAWLCAFTLLARRRRHARDGGTFELTKCLHPFQ